jgi:hypothetical protein
MMIFGLPLAHFLRLWLSIIGVITIVVLLPFVNGVGIGNYYYLFGLDLPKDAAEAADSCQLAGERVLSTFRLANSGQ